MQRYLLTAICLVCSAVLSAAELRPVEATVTMKNGETKTYAVFSNMVDKITVGQSTDDLKPASSVEWKRIASIDFGTAWRGVEFSRAMGALARQDYEKAIESFVKTADGKSEIMQVESHKNLATAYVALKDYDKAAQSLQAALKKFPQHRDNAQLMFQIGNIMLQKGDAGIAEQAAAKLDSMNAYAPANVANAAILRSAIAKASGDMAKAVTVMKDALGKIKGEESPEAMASLVKDLTAILLKEGKHAEVISVGQTNQWWPHSNGDISGGIHLDIAKSLQAGGKLEEAFHQAALAAATPNTSGGFGSEVKDFAKSVIRDIKAANEGNEEIVKTYTKALSKF